MSKTPLTEELDRLGLNQRRDDPVEEAERIKDAQDYCRNYVWVNSGQLNPEALHAAIGTLVSTCESSELYLIVGAEVTRGGKKGSETAHGTEIEKSQKWAKYQAEVDKLHELRPLWSYETISEVAAKAFGVHKETIKRHTVNPRKK